MADRGAGGREPGAVPLTPVGAPGRRLRTARRDRGPLDGEWLLAAILAGYVVLATRDWNVPYPGALPFGPLWVGASAASIAVWAATGRRLTAVSAIALGALAAMALTDVSYLATQGLRDLHLYLRAGERFLDGGQVYLDRLFVVRPADLATYPFLYPPPTLPVFGALSRLPAAAVDLGWLGASIAASLGTLRWFGVSWRWTGLLLLWPPIFQGLQVGNVAVPLGLLFAIAPWAGAGLVLAAVFKVYSGLAALWLVRERRLGSLALGVAIVVAWALLTLPFTGLGRWAEWWRGLELFRASQPLLADYLYGFGLPRYVPPPVAIAVGGLAVVGALRAAGREGLARLGLATAIASPSLYAHGLIVALPSFLLLRRRWLWTVLAITSVSPGLGWWVAIGIGVAGWTIAALRVGRDDEEPTSDASLHPLWPGVEPWPRAPAGSGSQGRPVWQAHPGPSAGGQGTA